MTSTPLWMIMIFMIILAVGCFAHSIRSLNRNQNQECVIGIAVMATALWFASMILDAIHSIG